MHSCVTLQTGAILGQMAIHEAVAGPRVIDEARARRLTSPALSRAIREAHGLSQEAIAAELGVDRVSVARWEAAERRPRGPLLIAYAELLRSLLELGTA